MCECVWSRGEPLDANTRVALCALAAPRLFVAAAAATRRPAPSESERGVDVTVTAAARRAARAMLRNTI